MSTRPSLLHDVTEEAWQRQVLELAQLCGWRTFHARPARTATGWRTPVSGAGAGFPDLVMVRGPRVLFVELKRERGRLSPLQEAWLADLRECPGIEVYEWRPSDWETVVDVLRRAA